MRLVGTFEIVDEVFADVHADVRAHQVAQAERAMGMPNMRMALSMT